MLGHSMTTSGYNMKKFGVLQKPVGVQKPTGCALIEKRGFCIKAVSGHHRLGNDMTAERVVRKCGAHRQAILLQFEVRLLQVPFELLEVANEILRGLFGRHGLQHLPRFCKIHIRQLIQPVLAGDLRSRWGTVDAGGPQHQWAGARRGSGSEW